MFHRVLTDISMGRPSNDVRKFLVDAYARGAQCGCASNCELEGSTAVFTKRRYRDAWNRVIVRSLAAKHGHSLKIKARVRARGSEQYYGDRRTKWIRSRVRSQNLWSLHLAGDFHESFETVATRARPHMMRCMLISNLAVDQRFANGTQGRLLYWSPGQVESKRALSSTHIGLMARFVKESSMKARAELLPDIDFMDVQARAENLACSGEPLLIQMPLVPCYAITVHKSQSLSIKHLLRGSVEGIFAVGHLYVLISRATDPQNVQLVGLPPMDMLDDVEAAWARAGLDVHECWRRAISVTNEWVYTPGPGPVGDRITQRRITERSIPLKHRTLAEVLDPQPRASAVIHRLLAWIDSCDMASQRGEARPPFIDDIFADDQWWLTDLLRRPKTEEADEDGPPTDSDAPADEVDSDPLSDEEPADTVQIPEGLLGSRRPLGRAVHVGWRGRKRARNAKESLGDDAL